MPIEVVLDSDAVEAVLKQYPTRAERATIRSLNRALTSGRALMASLVAKDMGMKVGDAKEAIFIERATEKKLSVRLVASKVRRPLYDFNARQTRKGVTFRGAAGRQTVPGAFIAGVQTGHEGVRHLAVFKRRGKKRLPIYELFGVSIGHVFIRHQPEVLERIRAVFAKNIAHELAFAATEKPDDAE